jgi:3-phenylpropionate/cinnamic acid dioxygenase small subunit
MSLNVVSSMQLTRDPSISSYYVNDAFYRELVENFSDWQRDDLVITDATERDRFRAIIEREARLLDQLRFDEWLALYCPECIYWVPGTPEAGDPRREIAISFDDRRRMEDRIYRLRTGYAWSQAPKSRTVRMVSNVEVFAAGRAAARMVRSNYLVSELRVDGTRYLSGWCGHRFIERDGHWLIQVRQVNLIDCDQNLRNPSIVL